MDWLARFRQPPPPNAEPEDPRVPGHDQVERGSPGVEALFEGRVEDGSHAILDLGSASGPTFEVYRRFARQILFADLLTDPPHGHRLKEALAGLKPPRGRLFDLVLAWNLLDLLTPEERSPVIRALARVTGAGGRLYVLVDASGGTSTPSLRFHLAGLNRVRHQEVGPPHVVRSPLLPAEVERLLSPFEVFHAFTLRHGLREYIGVKGGDALRGSSWSRE